VHGKRSAPPEGTKHAFGDANGFVSVDKMNPEPERMPHAWPKPRNASETEDVASNRSDMEIGITTSQNERPRRPK